LSSKKNNIIKSGQDFTSTPGFFRRLAAQIYDTFLLAAILILANAILYLFTTGELIKDYQLLQRIYLATISFLFYGWFWTHGGQTLGLRAWKIKVLTLDQKPISWKQALLRYTTAIISWSFLGLGFLWIFMNKNRYSWHDYSSKTALFFETKK
jgi:uncharacterized RDD family membrane protein YckC